MILFVVPNVVQVSVIAFDMNKYFQAMAIALALLAGWLVRRWPLPALALVFALAIPSPLLVSAWTAFNREQVLSADQLAASSWIVANTPGDAVFATDGWLNSPTDAAGRLRLTTFSPYVANLGYDPDIRTSMMLSVYCGGNARALRAAAGSPEGELPDRQRPTSAVRDAGGLLALRRVRAGLRQPVPHHLSAPSGHRRWARSRPFGVIRIIRSMTSATSTSGAVVELDHVTKRYGPPGTPPAVNELSLTVPAGEICVLVGPRGAARRQP